MGRIEMKQLERKAWDRFLLWKRIHYWLATPDFQSAYMNVSRDNLYPALKALDYIIENGDLPELRNWTLCYTKTKDLSFRQLRERARLNNIFNYSRISKSDLLQALGETKYGTLHSRYVNKHGSGPYPQEVQPPDKR